jgi:anti-sigma factor (TIGR02949 family)
MSHEHIDCEQVIRELFAYLDREVDEQLGERIQRHLKRCHDCFSRAEFERRLRERLRETTEAKAPDRLERRLRRVMDSF